MAVIQYEKRPALTLQKISICRQGHNVITKVFIPESDWGDNSFKALTYIPRKTFPATEEKIARYFDSIKKVPSSSALSSSSGSSKRKRGSNNEKTPRKGSRIKRDSKQTVLEQQSDSLQEKKFKKENVKKDFYFSFELLIYISYEFHFALETILGEVRIRSVRILIGLGLTWFTRYWFPEELISPLAKPLLTLPFDSYFVCTQSTEAFPTYVATSSIACSYFVFPLI
ncbi:hypothetical protein SO802_035397, partial [Lithocarpus litseifolius]